MSLFNRSTKARALQDQCDRLLARNAELLNRLHAETADRQADARHAATVLEGVKAACLSRVEDAEALKALAEQRAAHLERKVTQLETDLAEARNAHRRAEKALKLERVRVQELIGRTEDGEGASKAADQ